MDLKQYQEFTKTTVVPSADNLDYYVLGLVSEVGELIQANKEDYHYKYIEKELGDILWYVSRICSYFNISVKEIFENTAITNLNRDYLLIVVSAAIAGIRKKEIRDDIDFTQKYIDKLTSFILIYKAFLHYHNYSLSDIMTTNIEKLTNRVKNNTIKGDGDDR